MSTPSIQTLITQAQQVLNLKSSNEIRATLAAILANANVGTPLNPNLTTQQLWDEFYEIVRQPSDDILSIITDQMMRMVFSPPAPGGAGADKQVIFNDMGVLAGDAGLVYNKTTDALTVAGLVTAGSATISGALGVSGAANFNGGALAAYVNGALMFGSGGNVLNIFAQSSGFALKDHTGSNNLLTAATTGFVFGDGAGGTRMTLNSTGLGIGASPSYKLEVVAPAGDNIVSTFRSGDATAANNAGGGFRSISSATAASRVAQVWLDADGANFSGGDYFYIQKNGSSGTVEFNQFSNAAMTFLTNGTERMRIDSSGNVGIGVVPSATDSTYYQALELARVGQGLTCVKTAFTSTPNSWLSNNSYATYSAGTVWKYAVSSQSAAQYRLAGGEHQWFNAPSGTAGNAITFTQAMTLDASGNLLIKKTSVSGSTLGCELTATGQVNGASANLDNLNIFNTTAGLYRFYVSGAGTVFATNTVISAISDARLKENVQDIDVGLAAILSLKPRKFDWKAGKGKDIKGDRGFIAQEFETVFPHLIDEWKDPAPEGEAPYKSVRQDLIPVLVKAIQELTARVQTLEAR